MASKGIVFNNDFLNLIFNGIGIPNLADNTASAPLVSLYVSLHKLSPGQTGNQTTNEATYQNYSRVAILRDSSGWIVTSGSVSPASTITFPQCLGGNEMETYFCIGTASQGTGKILYFGQITPGIYVTTDIIPEITPDSTITEG